MFINIELTKVNNPYIISVFETNTEKYDCIGEYVQYSVENQILTIKGKQFVMFIGMANVILKVNE